MGGHLHDKVKAATTTIPASISAPFRSLQRRCACGGTPGPDGECAACRNKRLQRRAASHPEPATAPPVVHEVLRSPGQPLDAATRAYMEPRFGHDFGRVRVHSDAKAAESARAVNALAYTVGRDVVFGAGEYAPWTTEGRSLLAHELAHTIQQGASRQPGASGVEVEVYDDSGEVEAEQAAQRVTMPLKRLDIRAGQHSFVHLRRGPPEEGDEEAEPSENVPPVAVSPGPTGPPRLQRRARALWPVDRWENPAARIVRGEAPGETELEMNGQLIRSGLDLDAAIPNPSIVGRPASGGGFECKIERPIDLTCRNRRIMPLSDQDGAWWSRIDVATLQGLGVPQCAGVAAPDGVRFKLTAKPSANALYRRIIRSEYEHVMDTFESFRAHLVPLHDRYAHHAANATTGPDDQTCAKAILDDVDREQRITDFLTDYLARQQAHDGPGGDHHTDAPISVNPGCTLAHARAEV